MSATRQQKLDRLLVLASWLEEQVWPALNGAKFDMGKWGNEKPPKSIDAAKECGYCACAIGWGLVCPDLRRGLTRAAQPAYIEGWGIDIDEEGAAKFFGIDFQFCSDFDDETREYSDTFSNLFMDDAYKSPTIANVVARLRETHRRLSGLVDAKEAT